MQRYSDNETDTAHATTRAAERAAQTDDDMQSGQVTLKSAPHKVKALWAGFSNVNAAYGAEEHRSVPVLAGTSVVAAIILGALLAATIYLIFSGNVLRAIAALVPGFQHQDNVFNLLNTVAMAAVGILALGACYAYLPAGKRRFAAQLPGAILASLACGVLTVGFRVYVDNFCNFDALYGSIATVALFLFWMYLVSYIFIVGGFANRTLEDYRTNLQNASPAAPPSAEA